MASTYTDNNGIEKPGSGEQSGTWGDTTNTNFDIIDRAINGVGSISLSGTTHTLTTSDGAQSEGHYKVLFFTGSPTGTNTVTISPNDQDKIYFVQFAGLILKPHLPCFELYQISSLLHSCESQKANPPDWYSH